MSQRARVDRKGTSVEQGIAAVAEDEAFVQGQEYTFKFDFTTWGWVHIVLGVVMIWAIPTWNPRTDHS